MKSVKTLGPLGQRENLMTEINIYVHFVYHNIALFYSNICNCIVYFIIESNEDLECFFYKIILQDYLLIETKRSELL